MKTMQKKWMMAQGCPIPTIHNPEIPRGKCAAPSMRSLFWGITVSALGIGAAIFALSFLLTR